MLENTAQQQLQCSFWFISLTTIRPFNASMTNKHRKGQICKLQYNWFTRSGKELRMHVVISPCWLIHTSLKLFLCLSYKASSRFLICQHLQCWLSFKNTPMSLDRPWSSQENWRWTGCTFLVLCLLMCLLSTHYTMNRKMRREQFNKHSFDLKGKMSIYSCFKYVSKMRVETWEQVLEKRSQLIFKKCQLAR